MTRKAYLAGAEWMTPRFPDGDAGRFSRAEPLECIAQKDVRRFGEAQVGRWRAAHALPSTVTDLALAAEVTRRLMRTHGDMGDHRSPHLVFAVQESALAERLIVGQGVPAGERSACEPAFAAELLGRITGAGNRATWVNAACATGNYALGTARDMVLSGDADAVVVVAACALFECADKAFERIGLAAGDRCIPCHPARDGAVVSEGAAALLVTSSPPREVLPIEIAGVGLSADAFNQIMPEPSGRWVQQSMSVALAEARISGAQVDYVNLHGTGTQANDDIELAALGRLGMAAAWAGSTKAYTGHCLLAASAVEIAICRQLMLADRLPRDAYLNLCPETAGAPQFHRPESTRERPLAVVMSNSFGFGGANSSVLLVREAT